MHQQNNQHAELTNEEASELTQGPGLMVEDVTVPRLIKDSFVDAITWLFNDGVVHLQTDNSILLIRNKIATRFGWKAGYSKDEEGKEELVYALFVVSIGDRTVNNQCFWKWLKDQPIDSTVNTVDNVKSVILNIIPLEEWPDDPEAGE